MGTRHLKNISIAKFEAFLELAQCKFIKSEKGHVKYTRSDLNRPIIFQSHIDPIPEFIIKNALRPMGYSKDEFHAILELKCKIEKQDTGKYLLISLESTT